MSGPFYHQRSEGSSRSSLPSMQAMPYIAPYGDAYNPAALPRGPLRVPQKHQRRSSGPGTYPPPYASSDASTGNITPPPPPQQAGGAAPATTAATAGGEPASKEVGGADESGGSSDRTEVPPEAGQVDSAGRGGGHEEKAWFAHRRRSCRFLVVVGVVTAIIVGLAVGLAVGLRKRGSTSGKSSQNFKFPAGSYTFAPSLKREGQGCTSRASTWRCDPADKGDAGTLYWDIKSQSPESYTISSAPSSGGASKGSEAAANSLSLPSFSNLKMRLVDANQPTERLVFSLAVNKTVEPTDAGSALNRAAKCTYEGAEVEATLYTRRRDGKSFDSPSGGGGGSGSGDNGGAVAWPGDIEVSQLMNSTIGQPTCEDSTGRQIADVQAASGTCECMYSNTK
ncbi:tat pathway signal sequence [Purpureocillium lavendulum]|uniref:Tat pathway signal sequence n=1 Tax=Purpureocillium lavendulum TaxID=1247861 RepID=A0AB34FW74_9HYPO|nr:tat pathway signal sequence [Purpureocillium lavendulum]